MLNWIILLALAVTGNIQFAGEPPEPTAFEVGLCDLTEEWDWCTYSVVPPAHKAPLQPDGSFRIEDVPPGDYGLVFEFNQFYQIMPWYPDESGEILFTVTNQDYDIGDLHYEDIPCDLISDWRCGNRLALPIVRN